MKIIVNKFIPVKRFTALTFYNIIFWQKAHEALLEKEHYKEIVINHESIHMAQERDFALWLGKYPTLQIIVGGTIFYVVYIFYWLLNLIKGTTNAVKSIPFEKEAYAHDNNLNYLEFREDKAWKKYKV